MKNSRNAARRKETYGARVIASLKQALAIERGEMAAPKVSTYVVEKLGSLLS